MLRLNVIAHDVEVSGSARHEMKIAPFLREGIRNSETDTLRAAGDQHRFSSKI